MCEQQGGPFQLFRGKAWAELCRWCVCARARTVSYACCVFVVLSVSCAVCVCKREVPFTFTFTAFSMFGEVGGKLQLHPDLPRSQWGPQGESRPVPPRFPRKGQATTICDDEGGRKQVGEQGMLEGALEEMEDFLTAPRGHSPLATGPP